jgi:NADH-ubiquinone oxidoreductase chain 2
MLISILISLIVSNATTTKKEKSILYSRVVIQGLLFAVYIAYNNLYVNPLEKGIGLYGGLFNVTTFTQSFNIFILIIGSIIVVLTAFYPRKIITVYKSNNLYLKEELLYNWTTDKKLTLNAKSNQFNIIEYALIITFVLTGAVFLMSTGDLISLFLSIELQSYGLYILSTLYRDSESATGSGLTYFLLGGLSSCFILFGSALLYVNSGTSNLDNIYIMNSISEFTDKTTYWYQPYYIHYSLIILVVGLLFKVSAAPFHFWSPDVYDGIPTIVTTFVATIAKISIFVLMLEIVLYIDYENTYINIFNGSNIEYVNWKSILIISSLMSLIIGSLLGLTQYRIKRLFAYSTISHVGFILLSLSINKIESVQGYIFYILQYSLSNVNAFFILIAMGFTLYLYVHNINNNDTSDRNKLVDVENSPIQLISQIKGYFYINSFLSISLAITLFSFVGIPPLIGFFAKQMVLSAALDEGYIFMTLLGIITSVIGAVYYLNLVKLIFFDKSDYEKNQLSYNQITSTSINKSISTSKDENNYKLENYITINGGLSIIISVLTMLILLFIYVPGEWFRIVSLLSITLFKT